MTRVILASKSAARRALLGGAGVACETIGSGVDEDEIKADLLAKKASPKVIAERLARAKATAVSVGHGGWVVGADQTLDLDGVLFDKPANLGDARRRLEQLRGRQHWLHSAVAVARDGAVVWEHVKSASLTMRHFSDAFLEAYLTRNAEAVLTSVGAYQLEGEGLQLFSAVDGDYFTILGLPMLGLLDFLRRQGVLPA